MGYWNRLTPERRQKLEAGEAAMKWLHRGESIERWREVGGAANELQGAAMDCANTNKPTGKGYNRAWAELAEHVPHIRDLHTTTRTHASWLDANWEAVSTWLHTLAVNERMRLNHPTAIRRRYDATHKLPEPPGEDGEPKPSPHASYKAEVARLETETAELKRRLQSAEREGSLFSLDADSADDIGRAIAANVSTNKAEAIARAIRDAVKARRTRQSQAG